MNFLKQLGLQWKLLMGGVLHLGYLPAATWYSRQRDRLEQNYPQPDQPSISLIKLIKAETTATGARFYGAEGSTPQATPVLEIHLLTADFVRLTWQPGLLPIPYAIAKNHWDLDFQPQLIATEQGWTLSTPALQIQIDRNGSLQFFNPKGQLLRSELPPQKTAHGWRHQAQLQREEAIYGLGERAFPLNLRLGQEPNRPEKQPKTYRMWNFDPAGRYGPGVDPMYICIPVYLGLHHQGSYLIFYENSFEARFTFTDLAEADFDGGALRYYMAVGAIPQLLERYTALTGRAPLPPRWALGYHQSRWGYGREEEIRKTYQQFERHDLPLQAIHLDIDVQVGSRAFTIDPQRFPKLNKFIQELAVHGVHFVTIINPGMKYSRQNNLFLEGQILDGFCKTPNGELVVAPVWPGWTVFPDFTHPMVRRWWSRQYEYLLDVGVSGFWHDMNEPTAFIAWGDRSLPKVTRHFLEGRGGEHREAHNVYGLLQAKAAYEALNQYHPHRRPFIVTRSGWAGIGRYAWTWTGDIESSWAAMRQTVATVTGLGLSGVPYSGPDIGGFQGNPSAELYLRWFQMSSFLTFCRTHSANNVEHRAPYSFGEPTLSVIRDFLKLRCRLMPYLYTLAWETREQGYPPVRPVFWADPQDPTLWSIDDAFLLGNALLVCPIFAEGERQRGVTLPGSCWYDFWEDTQIQGGKRLTFDAPLERIPLLIKAGTVLPMGDNQQLTLHLYPPVQDSSESQLYLDAGDGNGEWRLDTWQFSRQDHELRLEWQEQGEFGIPYQQINAQIHGVDVLQAWMNEEEVSVEENAIAGLIPSCSLRLLIQSR